MGVCVCHKNWVMKFLMGILLYEYVLNETINQLLTDF